MLEMSQLASKEVQGVKLGHSIRSKNGMYIYHISIIDYLQKYDIFKRLERYYKIFRFGADG
jgi:tRNA A58 N-methylase Trm61